MKQIIIKVDGGGSSQIGFHIAGKYFEDLGYKVLYDLTWFKEDGKDINGIFSREYIMDKAFPKLKIEIATDKEIELFRKKYYYYCDSNNFVKQMDYMYLDGYPAERNLLYEYHKYFRDLFNPVDVNLVSNIVEEVLKTNSCAVHVRRGDLSQYNKTYGYPPDKEYFLKAIKIMKGLNNTECFYFFSDEPEWVKENIFPDLKNLCEYKIIDKNDSAKGYLDLYIMSRCKNIIGSHGSFGTFAKMLNINEDCTIILPKIHNILFKNFKNVILLNHKINPKGNYLTTEQENKAVSKNLLSIIKKIKEFFTHKTLTTDKKIKRYRNYVRILSITCVLLIIYILYITFSKNKMY